MIEINDFTKIQSSFKDTGEGDVDFYSFWYSICHTVGMLNAFRSILRSTGDREDLLLRFFTSKEIAVPEGIDLNHLIKLFDSWSDEVSKRGTLNVNQYRGMTDEIGNSFFEYREDIQYNKDSNSGVGVLNQSNLLVGNLGSPVGIGRDHIITFDVILKDHSGNLFPVDGDLFLGNNEIIPFDGPAFSNRIHLKKEGIENQFGLCEFSVSYFCENTSITLYVDLDVNILNKIKLVRIDRFIALFVNDEYYQSNSMIYSPVYSFVNLFDLSLPAVANLSIGVKSINWETTDFILWKCCDGSGFTIESNRAPNLSAKLSVDNLTEWDRVWFRDKRFSNTNFIESDGELRRLINYKSGEHLFELISNSEMGWCLDLSSPISEEANCLNLNKLYSKGDIDKLSKLPLTFTSTIKPIISFPYVKYIIPYNNTTWLGINSLLLSIYGSGYIGWRFLDFMKPNGQIPGIPIPIASYGDNVDGYEISFVIKSSAAIKLKFGIIPLDDNLSFVQNVLKKYSNNSNSYMFLDSSNFTLCQNRDVWIRGVLSLSKLSTVSNMLNIGIGDNLYYSNLGVHIKYVLPVISYMNLSGQAVDVSIRDIVLRPLSLESSKGVISHKNKIVGFMKNSSGKFNLDVENFIDDKLIPYNCSTQIKFI